MDILVCVGARGGESSTGGIIPLWSRAGDQILPAVEDSPPLQFRRVRCTHRKDFGWNKNPFVFDL
jgi:hypothetical protein